MERCCQKYSRKGNKTMIKKSVSLHNDKTDRLEKLIEKEVRF